MGQGEKSQLLENVLFSECEINGWMSGIRLADWCPPIACPGVTTRPGRPSDGESTLTSNPAIGYGRQRTSLENISLPPALQSWNSSLKVPASNAYHSCDCFRWRTSSCWIWSLTLLREVWAGLRTAVLAWILIYSQARIRLFLKDVFD